MPFNEARKYARSLELFTEKEKAKIIAKGIPEEKKFTCEKCARSYTTKHKLLRHIKTFHDRVYEFKCEIGVGPNVKTYSFVCNADFTFNLTIHISHFNLNISSKKQVIVQKI